MDIGFIGVGQMGFHMARRLLEAGHRVLVCDSRREAVDRLTAIGASARDCARAIADEVETVMVSLPTPDVVLAVATGKAGVIGGKRVRRFIDLSTTGAVMAKRIFDLLKARNITQIDSPVSGGVTGAAKGTLAVMVSGPRAEAAHVEHQKREGRSHLLHRSSQDENWPAWYASYMVAEQAGSELPT